MINGPAPGIFLRYQTNLIAQGSKSDAASKSRCQVDWLEPFYLVKYVMTSLPCPMPFTRDYSSKLKISMPQVRVNDDCTSSQGERLWSL